MRVAQLDMRDNSAQCPSTLILLTNLNKRVCATGLENVGCSSVIFPTTIFKSVWDDQSFSKCHWRYIDFGDSL